MNRKLLFITLLCINAHNYGAQQNDGAQNAQPRPTLLEFLNRQRRVLESLNNIPPIPTDPMLANAINRSETAAEEVRLSSFMLPTLAFVIPAALLSGESKLPFVVAAGFLGGISGALFETARRNAAHRKSIELQNLTPYRILKTQINALNSFQNLESLSFPYFFNGNPNDFSATTYYFTALYASSTNPYPILTAKDEMFRLIEVVRELRETLTRITSTLGQTESERAIYFRLQQINQDLATFIVDPLLHNSLNLALSVHYINVAKDKMREEYHKALLEKLTRQ